jgi:hypothetical protein
MRALIIGSSWVDKILAAKKTWEIRGSRTSVRETIGLIPSRFGTIVGLCDVVDCIRVASNEQFRKNARKAGMKPEEAILGHYKTTFAWVLANPQNLNRPVPYKHRSGAVIWVKLDERTERAVQKQRQRG